MNVLTDNMAARVNIDELEKECVLQGARFFHNRTEQIVTNVQQNLSMQSNAYNIYRTRTTAQLKRRVKLVVKQANNGYVLNFITVIILIWWVHGTHNQRIAVTFNVLYFNLAISEICY